MGLWSSIKKAAKKVWRAAKAVVRVVVRAVIEVLNRVTFGLLDLVFGFFAWPRKRLRLHVFILWSETPPVIEGNPAPPIEQVVQDAIEVTKRIYKERFNVDVLPYSKSFIQVIQDPVPDYALDVSCNLGIEFTEAGEYYAGLLAGWNVIPITGTWPVTVFVVRDLKGFDLGCSMSVIADYVIVDRSGIETSPITLPHEIGHTCGLSPGPGWHDWTPGNLMYKEAPAGENVKWFQKNLLRSSRHVQYW
ncbi:MAG TPA: hypothetical protein VEX16_07690 [Methyloceanibacter sp.]|jgi:hypothetical protein|nr:hypothetical protein [Methyloceanibacter sp.]